MIKKYWVIFLKCIGVFAAGCIIGYFFYYFFSNQSAFIIEKFKLLQSFFGIENFSDGMLIRTAILTILLGNLVSIICYIALGFARLSLPISFLSGFFVIVFLFSGIIRHGTAIPLEVIILSSIEMLYRIIAVSAGEYISKQRLKNRAVPVTAFSTVFILYIFAAFYEVWQLYQ
jgi:hypothetical protein